MTAREWAEQKANDLVMKFTSMEGRNQLGRLQISFRDALEAERLKVEQLRRALKKLALAYELLADITQDAHGVPINKFLSQDEPYLLARQVLDATGGER